VADRARRLCCPFLRWVLPRMTSPPRLPLALPPRRPAGPAMGAPQAPPPPAAPPEGAAASAWRLAALARQHVPRVFAALSARAASVDAFSLFWLCFAVYFTWKARHQETALARSYRTTRLTQLAPRLPYRRRSCATAASCAPQRRAPRSTAPTTSATRGAPLPRNGHVAQHGRMTPLCACLFRGLRRCAPQLRGHRLGLGGACALWLIARLTALC
jgi:hypothetical protein